MRLAAKGNQPEVKGQIVAVLVTLRCIRRLTCGFCVAHVFPLVAWFCTGITDHIFSPHNVVPAGEG